MKLKIDNIENVVPPIFDENLGFGRSFSPNMFIMEYIDGEWVNPRITKFSDFNLSPSSMIFHYGQSIFEGMKAYKNKNGEVFLFRPELNMSRMNESAKSIVMPGFDEKFVLDSIKKLIEIDKDWIPTEYGYSLYIRPTMIATEPFLGVRPANRYIFFVITSPVGAYYSNGFTPVKIYVTNKYVRAVKKGVGNSKVVGNYAASLRGMLEGADHKCDQVLWLDAIEQKYIEEVGAMNIFFRVGDTVFTPELSGSILPGITRASVIEILKSWNITVIEKKIAIDKVIEELNKGSDLEMFGTGTAASISAVGEIIYQGKNFKFKNNNIAKKLFNYLTNLQRGEESDSLNFVKKL